MIYDIYHSTRFVYQHEVGISHNLIRLKPRDTDLQRLIDFQLEIEPGAAECQPYDDFFGNHLHHILVREPHSELKVSVRSQVEIMDDAIGILEKNRSEAKEMTYVEALDKMASSLELEIIYAKQFRLKSPLLPIASDRIIEYAAVSIRPERSLYEGVKELMKRIFSDFSFESGFSDISTPVEKVFEERKGVCQDFAHLALSALRGLGISARYISGYIETIPPEGAEKLYGTDASHAWISVFFPGYGWFDFDPTNNLTPTDQHILLGYGRDYGDIAPIQGVVHGSGSSQIGVMVDVSRV